MQQDNSAPGKAQQPSQQVNEHRLRSIIDAALDAFVAIDQSGVIIDWNPQAEATFGWKREEAVGRSLADTIIPADYREAHCRGMERFLATGESAVLNQRIELTALRRDGTEFPVELTIFAPFESDGQYTFSAFVRDTTERNRSADAIRESESLYHSLVDNLLIHVTRKDLHGTITYVNQTFCKLLGLPPEQILGKTDYDFFPSELADKYREDDRHVAETGEVFQCVEGNRVGDETRYMEVRKTPVLDGEGNTSEVQTIFWDVTEREHAHAALARSNRDLDQFVSVVAHDLHAPIRAVEGYCRLLQRRYQGQLDDEADQYLGRATRGVNRMQRLIDDLRAYAPHHSQRQSSPTSR